MQAADYFLHATCHTRTGGHTHTHRKKRIFFLTTKRDQPQDDVWLNVSGVSKPISKIKNSKQVKTLLPDILAGILQYLGLVCFSVETEKISVCLFVCLFGPQNISNFAAFFWLPQKNIYNKLFIKYSL